MKKPYNTYINVGYRSPSPYKKS